MEKEQKYLEKKIGKVTKLPHLNSILELISNTVTEFQFEYIISLRIAFRGTKIIKGRIPSFM